MSGTSPPTPHPANIATALEPSYEPPYAGAVQDEFAWHAHKYLADNAELRADYRAEGAGYSFAFDFVLLVHDADGEVRTVAVECEGARSYLDHRRLLRRDADVLGLGLARALYRFSGPALMRAPEDALYLLSQWEPEAFAERGRLNLGTLASDAAKALRVRTDQASALVAYDAPPDAPGLRPFLFVRRLDSAHPEAWAPFASLTNPPGRGDGAVTPEPSPSLNEREAHADCKPA